MVLGIIEFKGLPNNVIYIIQQTFQVNDSQLNAESIQISLHQGITIKEFNILDQNNTEKSLFSAKKINIQHDVDDLLNGKLNFSSFSLNKANIALNLSDANNKELLLISETNALISLSDNHLKISNMSANSGNLLLTLSGEIKHLDKNQPNPETPKNRRFTLDTLSSNTICQQIPIRTRSSIIKILRFLKKLPLKHKIKIHVKLLIDFKDKHRSKIELAIDCPAFLYQGIQVQKSNCQITIHEDGLVNINKISLNLDKQEYLEGSFSLNLKRQIISGSTRFNLFPDKLLKILSPKLRPKLKFLDFKNPVSANLDIVKLNLPKLSQGIIDKSSIQLKNISVRGKGLNFRGLQVYNYSGQLSLIGSTFQAQNIALFSKNLTGKANIFYNLSSKDLFVSGNLQGDPRELRHFVSFPKTRKILNRIWDDFKWSNISRPHFGGVYHNTRHEDGLFHNTFEGKLETLGATYRGVKTESLSADIYVHRDDVFLDQLTTTIDGIESQLDIAIHPLLGNPQVELSADNSQAELPTILQIISPTLPAKLSNIKLLSACKIHTLSATIPVKNSLLTQISSTLYSDRAEIFGHPVKDSTSSLALDNKILSVSVPAGKIYKGNASALYQQDITDNKFSLGLTLKDLHYSQLSAAFKNRNLGASVGFINAEAQLEAQLCEKGLESLNGTGKIRMTDGSFLQIPFLSPTIKRVTQFLPMSKSSTQVTEIYSDLNFEGEKVYSPKIASNGKLIAFDATGFYNWRTTAIKYDINVHYLNNIFTLPKPFNYDIVSKVISNASGISKAMVSGTVAKPKWKVVYLSSMKSFLSKIKDTVLLPFQMLAPKEKKPAIENKTKRLKAPKKNEAKSPTAPMH